MRRLLLMAFLLLPVPAFSQAPEFRPVVPDTMRVQAPADSSNMVPRPVPAMDSTLIGKSIYSVMPDCVNVYRSQEVRQAETARTEFNIGRSVTGYRIRIYFDNSQQARNISAATLESFRTSYPEIPAFRTFENSYFKVTVGNYRTRNDAVRALTYLKSSFPTAFIVEEKLKYPDF